MVCSLVHFFFLLIISRLLEELSFSYICASFSLFLKLDGSLEGFACLVFTVGFFVCVWFFFLMVGISVMSNSSLIISGTIPLKGIWNINV